MAYELRPGVDWSAEIRRIMAGQIATGIGALSNDTGGAKGVHEARKAIKRTRAVLHLFHPAFKGRRGRKLNRNLRDIARDLSRARDSQAMLETLSRLEGHYGARWNINLLQGLRAAFYGQKQRSESLLAPAIEQTVGRLEKLSARISGIEVEKGERAMRKGLGKTYSRAHAHFLSAYESGAGTAFHEWRKDAQRHWRHMRLLVAVWPDEMNVRIRRADALSKCLGEDHDLHILLGHARGMGTEFAGWDELENFFDGCVMRQSALRLKARTHGQLLFAEQPKAFAKRIGHYWECARARFGQGANPQPLRSPAPDVIPLAAARADESDGDHHVSSPTPRALTSS